MSIREIMDDKYKIKSQYIPDNLVNKEDFQKEIKIYTEEIADLKLKIEELKISIMKLLMALMCTCLRQVKMRKQKLFM